MDIPQPTVGPAAWPEVHRSNWKEMFPACVNPDLHFVEWTRYIIEFSYFVAAYTAYSSGCRLHVTLQLGL